VTFKVILVLPTSSNGFFSYSYAALDKISTDIARRAVPLRQLSFWLPHSDCYMYYGLIGLYAIIFYFFIAFSVLVTFSAKKTV